MPDTMKTPPKPRWIKVTASRTPVRNARPRGRAPEEGVNKAVESGSQAQLITTPSTMQNAIMNKTEAAGIGLATLARLAAHRISAGGCALAGAPPPPNPRALRVPLRLLGRPRAKRAVE